MSKELINTLPEIIHALQYLFQNLTAERWQHLFSTSHNSLSTSPNAERLTKVIYHGFNLGNDGILTVDIMDADLDRWVLHTSISNIMESIKVGKIKLNIMLVLILMSSMSLIYLVRSL